MHKEVQREEDRKNGFGRYNSSGTEWGKKIFSVSIAAMVTLLPECSKKCCGKPLTSFEKLLFCAGYSVYFCLRPVCIT